MTPEIFEREIAMCRELHAKKGGCAWGKCETCGVIPLLFKLGKGEIVENEEEIKTLKEKVFE